MTHSQASREQRRRDDIRQLERMYAQAEASERFYLRMQADAEAERAARQASAEERREFERAAIAHRLLCQRGWLVSRAWRVADWCLRRVGL